MKIWYSIFTFKAMAFVFFLTLFPSVDSNALPGGTWQSGIKIQNLDTVNDAVISVDLHALDGTIAHTIALTPDGSANLIARANSSVEVYLPSYSNITAGQYSAVVNSDRQISAVVTNTNYSYGLADSYNAPTPATTVYVPYVYHWHNSWSTEIFVQNASATTTVVDVVISNGTVSQTCTLTLNPFGSGSCDTNTPSFDSLGTGFIGSATITSTSQQISVMVNQTRLAGNGDIPGNVLLSHRSLINTDAGNRIVLPSLYKEFSGASGTWKSGIKIQNASNSVPATVDVVFTADPDRPVWTGQKTGLGIPAGGSTELYLPTPNILDGNGTIPDMFKGSAIITATSGNVLSSVIQTNYTGANGYGVAIGYLGMVQGSSRVGLPSLYLWPSGAGIWVSGIKIQNLGNTQATVDVIFYTDPDVGTTQYQTTGLLLNAGQAAELYLSNPILDGGSQIPSPWKGSAMITATGTTPTIGATVIHTNYGRHVGNMYSGVAN